MDAYGVITNLIYDDEDDKSTVEEVVVVFPETDTHEIYRAYRFDNWNDRNNSWSLFKED